MTEISVAMATYNGAANLREQLASLAGQTMRPKELVVSDDGSSDETLSIVSRFAMSAPFSVMLLLPEQHLGFADNFLHAAEHCTGDLVAFCDQDDVWLPEKLELCARRIVRDDSLIALHTSIVTDVNLQPTGLIWTQDIALDHVFDPLALDPFATGWGNAMVFRRDLLGLIDRWLRPRQPFDPDRPLSHDTWIYTLAAALGRVSHLAKPLILYRQHGANSMGVSANETGVLSRLTVALDRYRAQSAHNRLMAGLFADLGADLGPFSPRAVTAAARFRQRAAMSGLKASIYDGDTIADRFNAYCGYGDMLRRDTAEDRDLWIGARAKSFVLGVANARRMLPRDGVRQEWVKARPHAAVLREVSNAV